MPSRRLQRQIHRARGSHNAVIAYEGMILMIPHASDSTASCALSFVNMLRRRGGDGPKGHGWQLFLDGALKTREGIGAPLPFLSLLVLSVSTPFRLLFSFALIDGSPHTSRSLSSNRSYPGKLQRESQSLAVHYTHKYSCRAPVRQSERPQ
ncbi:hypothetical protein BC827DRAFT_1234818 [Russula dissimulans]|nr:hypothetical protein BC827DRAFT_1234818 [Russula dissimulans]